MGDINPPPPIDKAFRKPKHPGRPQNMSPASETQTNHPFRAEA